MAKHRGEPKVKYQITVMESERGWGQNYWTQEYDTFDQASAAIIEINAHNVSPVAPDYYIQADSKITKVENNE